MNVLEENVNVDETTDRLESVVGGIWLNFKNCIPEAQATILSRGFNLIIEGEDVGKNLSEKLDEDRLAGNSDSLLAPLITELLVDDGLDIAAQKAELFELLTNNIITLLAKLGVTVNEDNVEYQYLPVLVDLTQFFFEIDGYEDVIGLLSILEASDTDPRSRFIQVLQTYYGEDWDSSDVELLIEDISEMSLEGIRVGLLNSEEEEAPPAFIVKRVRDNSSFVVGTQAGFHVVNNGRLGGSLENLMGFFNDIPKLLDNPTPDNTAHYVREVIAIFLISDINTAKIKERLEEHFSGLITDQVTLAKVDNIYKELRLDP